MENNSKNLTKILLLSAFLFLGFKVKSQDKYDINNRDILYLTSGGKLNPLQAIMDIRHYTIDLEVDIAKQSIAGFAEVNLNLSQKTDTILFDLIHLYKVTSVKVNGKSSLFTQQSDKILITSPVGFENGNHTIKIEYNGMPPVAIRPPWDGGFTWTKDVAGNDWVAINIQGEGGKMYFPCKDHPSDEPNEGVDMKITIPSNLVVAGPGLLMNVTTKKNKSIYYWKTNYTISNYCILFNIGKYKVAKDTYTTIEGNKVPIEYYVLEADTAQAKKVIELKKRDTRILEKYFGEYPWAKEKIGIAEVPNPGMEHQTMITFDNKFQYKTINGQEYSDNLFHEYAHEWWANKVTNKDWAHMWIQEGIATYAEALAMLELGGETAYNTIIDGHRRGVKNRKAMVLGDEVTEEEVYSGGDIYGKGSFFMHSLRYLIGDEIFFPTLKKLANDPKYTYDNFVTTDDVENLFSTASGKKLKPFFDFYLRTTNVLDVNVKEIGFQKYQIKLTNFFMPLPFDIISNDKMNKIIIPAEGIVVNSTFAPQIDPKGFYLKKITIY
ncbi:M1 family metallopeptidase [Emticicia sp. SJ17W-69]|uniref:M1 family metallopeptidase n=1 Tax=Emticicia sp. SJ17W-69 TaxID=3421657 RepID=UPI003EB713A3